MKCELCNATMHTAGGVYKSNLIGKKRVNRKLQTLKWCTTADCPNREIHNLCRLCGKWIKTIDGIPPDHKCEVKK